MERMNIDKIRAVTDKATPGEWSDFIACSRQWLPALCDEVEENRKRIAELEKENDVLKKALEMMYRDIGGYSKFTLDFYIQCAREATDHAN